MKAKQAILYLWHEAVQFGIGVTFANTYGEATGKERYFETCDAFGREDAVRIVKSCDQLVNDLPSTGWEHWPALLTLMELRAFAYDTDYPHRQGVVTSTRDPNVNMYSEAVTPENYADDMEPHDDAYNYAKLKDTLESNDE